MDYGSSLSHCLIELTEAGNSLEWQSWDDAYIVYQTLSAETHVFNETTACILRLLQQGSLTVDEIARSISNYFGLSDGELGVQDFSEAIPRLYELGLIDWK